MDSLEFLARNADFKADWVSAVTVWRESDPVIYYGREGDPFVDYTVFARVQIQAKRDELTSKPMLKVRLVLCKQLTAIGFGAHPAM